MKPLKQIKKDNETPEQNPEAGNVVNVSMPLKLSSGKETIPTDVKFKNDDEREKVITTVWGGVPTGTYSDNAKHQLFIEQETNQRAGAARSKEQSQTKNSRST